MTREIFILELHKIGAIKFGEFVLKSGRQSPFYFDLRDMISYPDLLNAVSDLLVEKIKNIDFDYISGIPYTALPVASLISNKLNKPLIYIRKEEKSYGTKNLIIGKYKKGGKCLLIDDLITSGESILETAEKFEKAGLNITDVAVIIDRSANGQEILDKKNYTLHSLINLSEILQILKENNRLDNEKIERINNFVFNPTTENTEVNPNRLTQKLLRIIHDKKSRLVLSLDVSYQKDFFEILEQTAENIVMLKTHIDILNDFDEKFIPKLLSLAKKYNFMIFEDRKFADIGNTVQKQYREGIYKIKNWSDFVTVHAIPGEGILHGLFEETDNKAGFLLAKMSSKANLMNDNYTRKVFEMGKKFPDWVSGYIVHANSVDELKRLRKKIPMHQLLLMPGVKLNKGNDNLGQQYTSIDEAIEGGADLIIVGRGIIKAKDKRKTAKEYASISYNLSTEKSR